MKLLTEWIKRIQGLKNNNFTISNDAVNGSANSNVSSWLNSNKTTQNVQMNNELQKTVAQNNNEAPILQSQGGMNIKASAGSPNAVQAQPDGVLPPPQKDPNTQPGGVQENAQSANTGTPQPEVAIAPKPEQQTTTPKVNNPSPSYDMSSFESWYKSAYGKDYESGGISKTENMSDKDYELGNNLFQSYLQQQNLDKQYNAANQALDASKAQQRQEASILRDKMAKYLSAQNKNAGMDNLGVAQSLNMQADAQYANNLGAIETSIGNQKQDLTNNYMNNSTNLKTTEAANNQAILNKYQEQARADEQTAYNRAQDEYNKQKYEYEQAYKRAQDEYEKQKYEEQTQYNREQDEYEKQKYQEQFEYQKQQDELNRQEAKEQREYERTKADLDNAAAIADANVQEALLEGDYDKAKQYLEANKEVLGDETYKAYEEQAKQTMLTETKQSQTEAVNKFLDTKFNSPTDSKVAFEKTLNDIEAKYKEGALSEKDYNELKSQMEACTSNTCYGGWFIQGLGSGRENDDIDITLGSTRRGGAGAREFDLLVGKAVDKPLEAELNKLATGDENSHPAANANGIFGAWLTGDPGDSNSRPGKLVVLRNQMFIYTPGGWRTVKGDHSAVEEAVKAWKELNQK